ncbi:hypothetical protein CDD83_2836 [Cordyceps sp. RAO-2017]|nr:hypothetical protein CDD83_2836 [Cordyceps sp. RAO-2017]
MRLALDRPDRLARLVGCDFNAASSAANTAAWRDRVALADEDGGHGIRHLARQTVARWFHPASLDRRPDLVAWLTDMLAANDVAGFRHACTALWDYDMRPDMPACAVPALLVVGEVDAKGALVDAMAAFRPLLGSAGAELKVVPGVGHLPMVEDPDAFWATISHFL